MPRFLIFLVVLLLVVVEVMLSGIGAGSDISLQLWPTTTQLALPAALALAVAFAFGLWSMLAGLLLVRNMPSPTGWLALAAVFLAGVMLIAVARGDAVVLRSVAIAGLGLATMAVVWDVLRTAGLPAQILPAARIGGVGAVALLAASALLGDTILLRAALALGFAAGALGSAYYVFRELRGGRALETESRFGGLGGGLGGWRISTTASLLLLTVVLTGAAVTLATYNAPRPGTTPSPREETAAGAPQPTAAAPEKKRE